MITIGTCITEISDFDVFLEPWRKKQLGKWLVQEILFEDNKMCGYGGRKLFDTLEEASIYANSIRGKQLNQD